MSEESKNSLVFKEKISGEDIIDNSSRYKKNSVLFDKKFGASTNDVDDRPSTRKHILNIFNATANYVNSIIGGHIFDPKLAL
ncbi:hypothetical protein MHBO_001052 [Bonamia ostreae]|uniref:Uncharacterized protein n=1 Tax=Bonamia ostreae TaxID=126728 RepID=A0ABV2AHM6_9EUKA